MDDINIVTVCDSISELLWGLKSATTLEFQQNCNTVINSNTVQKNMQNKLYSCMLCQETKFGNQHK